MVVLKRLLCLLSVITSTVTAGSVAGKFDPKQLSANQQIFLSASGQILVLDPFGDKRLAPWLKDTTHIPLGNGEFFDGPLQVSSGTSDSSYLWAMIRSPSGPSLVRQGINKLNGNRHNPMRMVLNSTLGSLDWWNDTLFCLDSGRIRYIPGREMTVLHSDFPSSSGVLATSLQVWSGTNAGLLVWNSSNIWLWKHGVSTPTWNLQALSGVPTNGILSVGLWGTQKWVSLTTGNKISWQGISTTDYISGSAGKFLADTGTSSVLYWQMAERKLWRLSPGIQQLLATGMEELIPAISANASVLLAGGKLASALMLDHGSIGQQGQFHHLGGFGISSFQVNPTAFSPILTDKNLALVTVGISASGEVIDTIKVLNQWGNFVSYLHTGKSLPIGQLATSWNGKDAAGKVMPYGKYKIVLNVNSGVLQASDTISVLLDTTAPNGRPGWNVNYMNSHLFRLFPNDSLGVNLANVLDDNDTSKNVFAHLSFINVKTHEEYPVEISRDAIKSNKIPFQMAIRSILPNGNSLPDGDYWIKWSLSDTLGNTTKVDSVLNSSASGVRDTFRVVSLPPGVRTSFSPYSFSSTDPVKGILKVWISGQSKTSNSISVYVDKNQVSVRDSSVLLDANGSASWSWNLDLTSLKLTSGIHTVRVIASSNGLVGSGCTVFQIGALIPVISSPASNDTIRWVTGDLLVRGTAVDPVASIAGTPVYRLAIRAGSVSLGNISWSSLGSSWTRLPVSVGNVLANQSNINKLQGDNFGSLANVGAITRIAGDQVLGSIPASILSRDSIFTVGLWCGKGDSVVAVANVFKIRRILDTTTRGIQVQLIRPTLPVVDWTGTDTLTRKSVWSLSSHQAGRLEWDVTLWQSLGNQRSIGYHWASSSFDSIDTIVINGRKSDGTFLAGGAWTLSVTGSAFNGQSWTTNSSLSIIPPILSPTDSFLTVTPNIVDLSIVQVTGMPHPKVIVKLPEDALTRVKILDKNGAIVSYLGPHQSAKWSDSWNGNDTSGMNRLSPSAGEQSYLFVLEANAGINHWIILKTDTLKVLSGASIVDTSDSGVAVDGNVRYDQLEANLISDYKLRLNGEGNLVYYPQRTLSVGAYASGLQLARKYNQVDYSMEWAKYYNSTILQAQQTTYWAWGGPYLAFEWRCFARLWGHCVLAGPVVTNHTTGGTASQQKNYTRWFFAEKSDADGLGVRYQIADSVIDPEQATGKLSRTLRLGLKPYFDVANPWDDSASISVDGVQKVYSRRNLIWVFGGNKYSGDLDGDPVQRVVDKLKAHYDVWNSNSNCDPALIDSLGKVACDIVPAEISNLWRSISSTAFADVVDTTIGFISSQSSVLQSRYSVTPGVINYSGYFDLGRPMIFDFNNAAWGKSPTYSENDYFQGPYSQNEKDKIGTPAYSVYHAGTAPNAHGNENTDIFGTLFSAQKSLNSPINVTIGVAATDMFLTSLVADAWNLIFTDPRPGNNGNSILGRTNVFLKYNGSYPGEEWWLNGDNQYGITSGSYDFDFHGNGNNDYGMRDQEGYTVPPVMNWASPSLYMHDSTVTVLSHKLFADEGDKKFMDGLVWEGTKSGKQIKGQSEFLGYKNGQRGYWFRPSQYAYDVVKDTGTIVPRIFTVNHFGDTLSELDYVNDYRHHVVWDSSSLSLFSNHNLAFKVRLKVNDTTFGVVWDTVSVPWPIENISGLLPNHLDTFTLPSRLWGRGNADDTGISRIRFRVVVSPDSLWDPRNGKPISNDSVTVSLRPFFSDLPDNILTASDSLKQRINARFGYVIDSTLSWSIEVADTFGSVLSNQSKVSWRLDSSERKKISYHDLIAKKDGSGYRKYPKFIAKYGTTPDTLGSWNTKFDPRLSLTNGWLYYRKDFKGDNFTTVQKNIRIKSFLKLKTTDTIPWYRPWCSSAFVRVESTSADTFILNPNLTRDTSFHWNAEIYYVDGETRNLDLDTIGKPSLDHLDLRLSSSRSSQRFVRLKGAFHRAPPVSNPNGWSLQSWKVWGVKDSTWTPLRIPSRYTDSLDRFRGIRRPSDTGDAWFDSTQSSDVAFWNVTGLEGKAQFACQAIYTNGNATQSVWVIRPFLIGSRRDTAGVTPVIDAYGRAQLILPPSKNGDTRPIVLHTLAGADLGKLPIPGIVPAGPVMQMLPSGMTFSPSAQISYRMSLREVLQSLYPDSMAKFNGFNQDSLNAHYSVWKQYAKKQLALYLLTDKGNLEPVPTVITSGSDSLLLDLDVTYFQLDGSVAHFSYCIPLAGSLLRNLPPKFESATWSVKNGLELIGNASDAKRIIPDSLPKFVRIHLQKDSIPDTTRALMGPQSVSLDYMSRFDSSWRDSSLSRLSSVIWAFARFPGSNAWAKIRIDRDLHSPIITGLRAVTPRISSTCNDSLKLLFTSTKPGTFRFKILDSTRKVVDIQTFALLSGANSASWSSCVLGSLLLKGRYQAYIEPQDLDGRTTQDTISQMISFGIDTSLPIIDSLTAAPVPFRRNLTGLGNGLLVSAYVESVPVGWQARLRARSNDCGAWTDVGAFSQTRSGLFQLRWNGKVGSLPAPAGVMSLHAYFVQDTSVRQVTRIAIDTSSLVVTMVAKPDTIVVGTRTDLNISLSLSEAARVVVKLQSMTDTSRTVRILGSGVPWLLPDSASWIPTGKLGLSVSSKRTDSLRGAWKVLLRVSDSTGAGWEVSDTVFFKGVSPHLTTVSVLPGANDTIWPEIDQSRLARMPVRVNGTPYQQKASLVVASDRTGLVIRTIRRAGSVLRIDTLALKTGSQVFTWDGTVKNEVVTSGWATLEYRATDSLKSAIDSPLVQSIWVERLPRAVIWAANGLSNLNAVVVRDYLQSKKIDARIYSSQWVLQYLDLVPKGTVILMDSSLPTEFYGGGESGALFSWCLAGGNLVFTGSPAFSMANEGGKTTDIRRQRIYGSNPLVQPQASQYLRFFRSGDFKVRDLDPLSKPALNVDTGAIIRASVNLDWLDSVGIKYEAGVAGWHIDSLHQATSSLKDSVILDSTRVGLAMYYPVRIDSATRRLGAMGEFPLVPVAQAQDYGQWLYVHFFAPDLSVRTLYTHLVIHPKSGRDTSVTWKPIHGDTVETVVSILFRSSDLVNFLDSAKVIESDAAGRWSDTIKIDSIWGGIVRDLPSKRHILDTAHPYNDDNVVITIVPFAQTLKKLNGVDTAREEYLANNTQVLPFAVGDTAKPILRFHGAQQRIDKTWKLNRPLPVGLLRNIEAVVRTSHKSRPYAFGWNWVDGSLKASDSTFALGTTLEDSTGTAWALTLPNTLNDGSSIQVTLGTRDRYGNVNTAVLLAVIDTIAPRVSQIMANSHILPRDTMDLTRDYRQLVVTRKEVDSVTTKQVAVRIGVQDNQGLDSVYVTKSSDPTVHLVWTWSAEKLKDTIGWKIIPDTLENPNPARWNITVVDRAGNRSNSSFTVFKEDAINPPIAVHVFDSTRVDSLIYFSNNKKWERRIQSRMLRNLFSSGNLLEHTLDTSNRLQPLRERNATLVGTLVGRSQYEREVAANVPVKLSVMWAGPSNLVSMKTWLDGKLIDATDTTWSAYPRLDTIDTGLVRALGSVVKQKLIRFTPNGREQILTVEGVNDQGDTTLGDVVFYGPDADLQTIDSAGDVLGHGPDFGEVYMRADTIDSKTADAIGRKTISQVWTYWLLRMRDADSASGPDMSANPWIVLNPDNDSQGCLIPGRTSLGRFKKAIELVQGDLTDAGTGARLKSWSCVSDSTSAWAPDSEAPMSERTYQRKAQDSLLFGANQPDDPTTETPGEGDQILPSGVIAKVTNGAWEIGWLTPWKDTIKTLRWAIVPSASTGISAPGDVVSDTGGTAFLFHPRRLRHVTVDGFTEEWLPKGNPTLDVYSTTQVKNDTVSVNLSVTNPSFRPVRGFRLRYFFTDKLGATTAYLDTSSTEEWVRRRLRVMGPGTANNLPGLSGLDASIHYVEIVCDSCILGTQASIRPLGVLRLAGTAASDTNPSWSTSSSTAYPNRLIPAYRADTAILISGREPTRKALRPLGLNVQVVSGDPNGLQAGSKLVLQARVTDPENRHPIVTWSRSRTADAVTGMIDTVVFAQNGAWSVQVTATDPEIFDRSVDTTLVFWVGVDRNASGMSGIRIDSSCHCLTGVPAILREVAPFTAASEVMGLRWLIPSEAASFRILREEQLPSHQPEGAIFNNPYLPSPGPRAPDEPEPGPCRSTDQDPDRRDPAFGRYLTLPSASSGQNPLMHSCSESAR